MKFTIPLLVLRTLSSAICLCCGLVAPAMGQEREPIAYIGHGAFFDSDGNEIVLTQEFVDKAQAWYRQKLLADLEPAKKKEFDGFEKWLREEFKLQGKARLLVRHAALEWLFTNSPRSKNDGRLQGKLRALTHAMS